MRLWRRRQTESGRGDRGSEDIFCIEFRMKIHHGLLFCFLSALCGGNSGLVDAKLTIFTGPEGGNGTINCYLSKSGTWKFFCKDECKDILIKTDTSSADNGRYRIKYERVESGKNKVTVTITNLVQSDAGHYRCGLGESSSVLQSFWDFDVKVSDGLLDKSSGFVHTNAEGEDVKALCDGSVSRNSRRMFFCRGKCENKEDILVETDQDKAQNGRYGIEYENGFLYYTIKKVVKSDSREYTCGYGRASSPETSRTFLILVDIPSTSAPVISSSEESTPAGLIPATSIPVLPVAVCLYLVGYY